MARITLIVALSMAMAISTLCSIVKETRSHVAHPTMNQESSSPGRVLAEYSPARVSVTCDNFPRLCRQQGSGGPDCCGKQCVDVDRDVFNCGECGRTCRYGEACCGGRCAKVNNDPYNCGSCYNTCKKGGSCKYGMCSYAD